MKKCVRITFEVENGKILESIKKKARSLDVEGIAYRSASDEYETIVHGEKEQVEKFIDAVHAAIIEAGSEDFYVEPYLKEEDYRGVFRVLQ